MTLAVGPSYASDWACPFCVEVRGSCCLCGSTRILDELKVYKAIATINVRKCGACDACVRLLDARESARIAWKGFRT